jgi:hypothetical protein
MYRYNGEPSTKAKSSNSMTCSVSITPFLTNTGTRMQLPEKLGMLMTIASVLYRSLVASPQRKIGRNKPIS